MKPIFDINDGDFLFETSDGIAYDSLSRDYRVAHYAGACRVL